MILIYLIGERIMARTKYKMRTGNNAVIYARFSAGPNQTEQSIEGQIRDCRKYAEENGYVIVDEYCDYHISGKEDFNRGEFQRMLFDAQKGLFDVVITWKIDRFGRNREEIATNKIKLKRNGVRLVYAMESIPDGPEGIILESVLEGLAEYYSADLAQKISRGMRESAMKGKVLGNGNILGYCKNAEGYYIVDKTTAPIVKEIFQMYDSGHTVPEIVCYLDSNNITHCGKKINRSKIYRLLRNQKYIGVYEYAGNVIEGAIPAIVDVDTFSRVQKRIEENKYAATRKVDNVSFILSGKTICGICGSNYSGESGTSKTGTIYRYYKCHGKKSKKSECNSIPFRKEWLEQFVLMHTKYDVLTDEVIETIADEIITLQDNEPESHILISARASLKETEKSISNILKAIEAGIFTETTKERLLDLENKRASLKQTIAIEELRANRKLTKDHIIFWFEKFRSGDIEAEEFQKTLIDVFINKIVLYKDRVVIAYNYTDNNHSLDISNLPDSVRLGLHKVD